MEKIITFIDEHPVELEAELYQHGIKIRETMLHYYGVEDYLIGNILMLSIDSVTGFISPVIPAIPTVENTTVSKEFEKVKKRFEIAQTYYEDLKKGKKPDVDLDELLPYLKIGETQYVNLIRTSRQMAIKIPMELGGRKYTGELDSKTSISVISNKIKIDKSKIIEERSPIGIKTVAGLAYTTPFKMKMKLNGKDVEIRAVQMELPTEDALIDPATAEAVGVRLRAEGIQQ
jgi:hypothetical protein